MPLIPRLKAAWSALTARAGGPAGYGMGTAWSGGPLYADRYGARRGPSPWQLVEGHKQIAFACGEYNALGLSSLPLRLYAASGGGRAAPRSLSRPVKVKSEWQLDHLRTLPHVVRAFGEGVEDVHEITNHEILRTVRNPAQDPKTGLKYFDLQSWIATQVRYIDTVGLAYVKPENAAGVPYDTLAAAGIVPSHAWLLQTQYVRPIRQEDSALIRAFGYFAKEYRPAELLFIRLRPSLRDPYGAGYAAMQAAWQYAGLEDSTISMWDQVMGGGARPNVIISPTDPLMPMGEDEARRYEHELNTFHARGRAGRSLVSRFPIKVDPINYPAWDMGELHVNEYQLERIANCYGVPVSYLTRETNLANFQAGRTYHAVFGINPRAECLSAALTDLVQRYDERLFFAFDCAVPEDRELKAKLEDMGLKNGRYTINQVNVDTPFPPAEYGEAPWQPGTLVQPDMAREKHEQGLKSAAAADKAKAEGKGVDDPDPAGAAGPGGEGAPADRDLPGPPPADRGVGYASEAERELMRRAQQLLDRLESELDR